MISVDTEATGLDLHHSARSFLVSVCEEDGTQRWWEWDVDPLTRMPVIDEDDCREIRQLLAVQDGGIVLHNSMFDAECLLAGEVLDWAPLWELTEDTIIAGHLLESNQKIGLTDMVARWLGKSIYGHEELLGEACKAARRWARSHKPEWQIAREGQEGFPSQKEGKSGGKKGEERDKLWKNDMWLPRALAKEREDVVPEEDCEHAWGDDWLCERCLGHRFHVITSEYANADTASTLALWRVVSEEVKRRKLWAIYRNRMKLPRIAVGMQGRGVTANQETAEELKTTYKGDSDKAGAECRSVAEGIGYDLELPKSGNNNSLLHFCFGKPVLDDDNIEIGRESWLDLPVAWRTDSGAPSLDSKNSIPEYLVTLDGEKLRFIKALVRKRKRDTMISYIEGYQRFWKPMLTEIGSVLYPDLKNWRRLHPHVNPVGSGTLRWSHTNPNSSNVSKQENECDECKGEGCEVCYGTGSDVISLRRCFGPAPGREWWSADAKNIELRLPAYLSGEQEIIALFEESDSPPYYGSTHLLNFHTVYPDIWEKELKEVGIDKVGPHCKKKYAPTWYQWCKNGGFAVQYGAIAKADGNGTADRAFHKPYSHVKLKERFARLEELNRECIRQAQRFGWVETIPNRTVDPERGYPLVCSRMENGRVLETVPLNYKIQGSAMDWTGSAMIKTDEPLTQWRKEGFDAFLTLQVHDELVFDLPKRADPRLDPKRSNLGRMRVLQRLMESCGQDFIPAIPTPVGLEFHPESWGEGFTF